MIKFKIAALIPKGRKNAIHQGQLADLLGVSRQELKAQIRKERLSGSPILSDNHGYWTAESEAEVELWRISMRKQALSILALLSHLNYKP